MFINRFPKMAALQKFRAIALGFDEKTAEAIGIAEATKYAIFKNLSYKRRKEQEVETAKKAKLPPLDEERFAIFKLQALGSLPFVGHRTYSSEDYQRAIFLRWGEEVAKKIENWAQKIIQTCAKETLENERKFFEECWKPHRDEDPLTVQ
jgi:hypothetical protein